MAISTSEIRLEIQARLEGFRDAVRGAIVQLRLMRAVVDDNSKVFDAVGKGIGRFLKSVGLIGAIGNAVGAVVGLTTSLSNLVPIIALAPAGLFTLAAAIGTFKLATAGFSDAVKGDADAMAKLAPAARETAKAVQALKPQFESLRKAVQGEFFKNFAGDVKVLGETYLPLLQSKLPRIAAAFNDMGRSVTRALTQPGVADDIGIALTNTAKLLENARNAVGHLVAAFVPLIAVGSTYLPNLGRAIDGAADRFRAWSLRVTSDGSLRDWVDRALEGFRTLGQVLGNFGDIAAALFRGLSTGPQQDFLTALRDSTQALEDFLNQPEAQAQLGAIGQAFADVAKVTREVFLEALRQVLPILAQLAPVVAEVARVIGDLLVNAMKILGPVLEQVAGFLNDNKTAIADLVPLVIGLWAAFKGAAILTGAITSLRALSSALGGPVVLLKAGGLVALGALAVKLNDINKAAAASDGRGLNDMEDTLDNIVGAGREILTLNFDGIFADIGEEWDQVVSKFKSGESPIGGFFQRLGTALETTRQSFVTIGTFFSDFITTTGESFGRIGDGIKTAFVTVADSVSTFFTDTIPRVVTDFFTSVGNGISTGASAIGTTVSDTFTTIVTTVQTKVQEIVTSVGEFLAQSPRDIGFAIGAAIGDMISAVIAFGADLYARVTEFMTQFGTAIQNGLTNAITFFAELPGRIGTALVDLATTLTTKAQEAGQAFLTWIGNFFTDTTTRAQQVPSDVGNAVAGTADTLRERAIEAGTQFVTWITNKFNDAVAFVQTVPGKVGTAISTVVGILRDKAIEAGTSFINGVTTKFNEAVEFVRGIPGKISSAIGNLGGLLVNAGKQAIEGLLNGIKSKYDDLISFVSGIADGIAAHKGPLPYDRKVLRPAGLALMGGLLDGMRQGQADVLAFTDTIAGAVAASTAAGTSSPTATTLSGSSSQAGALQALAAAVRTGAEQPVAVRVFIGDRELTDLVRVEVQSQNADSARTARAGTGVTWGG